MPTMFFLALALAWTAAGPSWATWSVVAVDRATEKVVIASATCVSQQRLLRFPSKGLMDVQAIVAPGVGVAAAQAGVDRTRANQRLIHAELLSGTKPKRIIEMLEEDPDIERRQFGIVDLKGRSAGFSGSGNQATSLDVQGHVRRTQIHFSIQGNILAGEDVVHAAAEAFRNAGGSLTDRVMAAMEAADAEGGDKRCSCETQPRPAAPCDGKTSHVAYLLEADAGDRNGDSYNDGDYAMYISVTDRNIRQDENANPVKTLRMRYDAAVESRERAESPTP